MLDTVGPGRALALLDEPKPATVRTVAQQVEHYIEHQSGITDGTRRRYRTTAQQVIAPAFSDVLLSDLSRDHVSAWVNSQTGVGGKTIANRHGLLSAALGRAVEDGLIVANPAYRVRLPERGGEEMVFLSGEEFVALLGYLPEHYRPLATLLGGTGVRFGEATALTVRDLLRPSLSVRVRRAWKYTGAGGGWQLGDPKSKRSKRTVAAAPSVFDALAPLIEGRKPGDFVFVTPRSGNPVGSGTFHKYAWQPAVRMLQESHGVKPRVHDLRHSFASWAIARNVPLPVIQRQLGHESIKTTVDTYGHLQRSDYAPLITMVSEMLAIGA